MRHSVSPGSEFNAWDAFIHALGVLNAFVETGRLREYQSRLLNCGEVVLPSPYSGRPVAAWSSVLVRDRIGYWFGEETPFWLFTGALQDGYPLLDLVTRGEVIDCDSDVPRRFQRYQPLTSAETAMLASVEKRSPQIAHDQHITATLLIGHPNFAHHMWNELSGLEQWLNTASAEQIEKVRVVASAEPLGALTDIFPSLLSAEFNRTARFDFSAGSPVAPALVRAGSRIVTHRMRAKICGLSTGRKHSAAVDDVVAAIKGAWPRVWISVRLDSRTPDNQEEFLLEVLRGIFVSYPNAAVVFDGFSFPENFFADTRMVALREAFVARNSRTAEFIALLSRQAAKEIGQDIASRIFSVSGLTLLEAISIGGHCDYYVCHPGTLQHKIAWLWNIPGFIHGNGLGPSQQNWYQAQVEEGRRPDVLPPEFSVVSSPPGQGMRAVARNFNYRIVNARGAAEAVLAAMTKQLQEDGDRP